jgi:ribosomal protein S18 acetylase RimI-like enzyme
VTAAADRAIDAWRDGDAARAAVLLRDAYPPEIGRLFAPHGTATEWRLYVTALVMLGPCGAFDPRLSRVIREGDALVAAALVTIPAPGIAHLAQLAVRPDVRRRGLAARLVRDVVAAATEDGRPELTLQMATTNLPARRLYESLGFTPVSDSGS